MDFAKSIIIIGLLLTFFFGQLLRLNLFGLSFPLIDIFIVLFSFINLLNHFFLHTLKPKNIYFLYFLIFAWFSFVVNYLIYDYPLLKPIFYLVRLSSLLSFFIFPPNLNIPKLNLKKSFYLIMIANVVFGLIQYFLWPDFTYFKSFNWDPHLSRLVSTYFDPTFTALLYLLFLIILYRGKYNVLIIALTYFAIALTYSRSTFLALVICSLFLGLKLKKFKIFTLTAIIVTVTILLLPRPPGEGTKLERTSSIKAKIENYKEGFGVFLRSPIIGHGYDNLSYVRQIKDINSHSNSGFDSSLLTILTTTGIPGLLLFIAGLTRLFQRSTLTYQILLLAIFIHSLFANSLLYPWILIFLILV
jgi:hypothetical protein